MHLKTLNASHNLLSCNLCLSLILILNFIILKYISIQMSNWKATADAFESLIERPKMTQKLLEKPPFKYIFDIIAETAKKTGFANGLYEGDELKADYYQEKTRKIAYLQKIISLVQSMLGEKASANPQKIVAGMDPEQTNELLQMIYKCAVSGKSSDAHVKRVLGGGAGPEEAETKPAEKKKIERPPSAAKIKKPEQVPKTKPVEQQKKEEKKQEKKPIEQKVQGGKAVTNKPIQKKEQKPKIQQPKQQQPPQNIPAQKSKNKEQYSKKVQQLMDEGEQEIKKEKQAAQTTEQNQNNIAMGRLGGGKKKKTTGLAEGVEKMISNTGQINEKQLDLVKSMIQSICQNTAPLGKSIEFINQDIQSMNKELQFWRKQYHASKSKLQNELKISEDALLPIYDKLGEIQQQIKDQKGKIQTAKAQIIKNDSTIRDLLMSVVTTR